MTKKAFTVFAVWIILGFSVGLTYKDGIYKGSSRAAYTDEPYYGHTRIAVEKGKIIAVEFFVRDSSKHEYMDDKYEKHFAGNNEYILQCRNDWKGIQSYPDSLLKYQDINLVDAISGATWSFNLFRASAQAALAGAGTAR